MNNDQDITPTKKTFADLPQFDEAEPLIQWLFEITRPLLKGRVLEIDSKPGHAIDFWHSRFEETHLELFDLCDTLLAINLSEHLPSMRWLHLLAKPGCLQL